MSDQSPAGGTTAVLVQPGPLPRPGTYRAGERSILELSAVLGPLTVLRRRFAVLENTLTVPGPGPDTDSDSDATNGATLALEARRNGILRLEADRIRTTEDSRWQIHAKLHLRTTPIDITLKTRIAVLTEDRIALIAIGTVGNSALGEARSALLPRSVPGSRVRLLLAADFR